MIRTPQEYHEAKRRLRSQQLAIAWHRRELQRKGYLPAEVAAATEPFLEHQFEVLRALAEYEERQHPTGKRFLALPFVTTG